METLRADAPRRMGDVRAALLLVALCLASPAFASQAGRTAHTFTGIVERVDAGARVLSVKGDEVKGWMAAMSMNYRVDKPEVLGTLKAGDRITATVYDGDYTTLHDIRVTTPPSSAASDLPPISYACPSPGEESVIEDKPGRCPKSGAALVPVRLTIAYSCLKVTLVIRDAPGVCPTDRTELVPITASLYFTCKADPSVRELNPGTCADGTPRQKAFDRIPHGDHNPRHGGSFFMASDQWHHIEGTFAPPNVFRVYFYDDLSRPLAASAFVARAVKTDNAGRPVGAAMPLTPSAANRSVLEARFPNPALPLNIELLVSFKTGDKEQVFDFTFPDYSREP